MQDITTEYWQLLNCSDLVNFEFLPYLLLNNFYNAIYQKNYCSFTVKNVFMQVLSREYFPIYNSWLATSIESVIHHEIGQKYTKIKKNTVVHRFSGINIRLC